MRYRLCQEVVLGMGGVRALRALRHDGIERFHMNEGHSSLLTLELLDERARATKREHLDRFNAQRMLQQYLTRAYQP